MKATVKSAQEAPLRRIVVSSLEEGDMDAQRAAWLKAQITESPDNYSNYLELADLYIRDEQFQPAYDCVSALLMKLPESVDVLTTAAALAVKLERFDEARKLIERILSDRTLSLKECGETIVEMIDTYIKLNHPASAYALLKHVSPETKAFVPNYDDLYTDLASRVAEQELELEVSDEESGLAYTTTTIGRAYDDSRAPSVTVPHPTD